MYFLILFMPWPSPFQILFYLETRVIFYCSKCCIMLLYFDHSKLVSLPLCLLSEWCEWTLHRCLLAWPLHWVIVMVRFIYVYLTWHTHASTINDLSIFCICPQCSNIRYIQLVTYLLRESMETCNVTCTQPTKPDLHVYNQCVFFNQFIMRLGSDNFHLK